MAVYEVTLDDGRTQRVITDNSAGAEDRVKAQIKRQQTTDIEIAAKRGTRAPDISAVVSVVKVKD